MSYECVGLGITNTNALLSFCSISGFIEERQSKIIIPTHLPQRVFSDDRFKFNGRG